MAEFSLHTLRRRRGRDRGLCVATLGIDLLVELGKARFGREQDPRAALFQLIRIRDRGAQRVRTAGGRRMRLVRRRILQPVCAGRLRTLKCIHLVVQQAVECLELGRVIGDLGQNASRTSLCASSCISTRRVVL